MAKFCINCGRPLQEGETCNCNNFHEKGNQSEYRDQPYNGQGNFQNQAYYDGPARQGFHQGSRNFQDKIGNIFKESMSGYKKFRDDSSYLSNEFLIPNIVTPNEGEVPIKQYNLAVFRESVLGFITTSKALGKLLVTNKRLIFSAKGRSINGDTNLQYEFLISEVGGLEVKKEYSTSILAIFAGLLFSSIISTFFTGALIEAGATMRAFLSMVTWILALVSFILLREKKFLALCLMSPSIAGSVAIGGVNPSDLIYSARPNIMGVVLTGFFAILVGIQIWRFAQVPDLLFTIKNKGSADSIKIQRKKTGFLGLGKQEENSGYTRVLPTWETDFAVKEIGALLNDIQVQGDYAIDKWKDKLR